MQLLERPKGEDPKLEVLAEADVADMVDLADVAEATDLTLNAACQSLLSELASPVEADIGIDGPVRLEPDDRLRMELLNAVDAAIDDFRIQLLARIESALNKPLYKPMVKRSE
ncbi:hypothetical protein [Roseateles oligotrophus]|uniref:Uncharacterized protein n=1 Tax=Roseateles oligotrophus TaxID=1769250 RepID=A0ABT2YFB2_9BURK|nr:hypothetical protein [Roseateles oligotrophus]MCV2368709.1 hypothetical protein [Roseateles oligotrophus]